MEQNFNYNEQVTIDPDELKNLYDAGNYDKISQIFFVILLYIEKNPPLFLDSKIEHLIDFFTENFIFYLTKPDYILSPKMAEVFIIMTSVITDVFAMSKFENTDVCLKVVMQQKNNFYKILVFYNCRNTIKIDRKSLFDTDPVYSSFWYGYYFTSSMSFQSKVIYENMNEHLLFWDEKIVLVSEEISYGYMISTYINPYNDRVYKRNFNHLIKKSFKLPEITNVPNKKKIAIIGGMWKPGHVNYRNCYSLIETLKDDYDLTFIALRKDDKLVEPKSIDDNENSIFKEIKCIRLLNGNYLDISSILNNDFIMAYYIDIGMEPVSRMLSNIRIAPIQVMTYGHPVSTFGSEIDYFYGGEYGEDVNALEKHYQERFVFTPGLGLKLTLPDLKIENKPVSDPGVNLLYKIPDRTEQAADYIINCSWSLHKFNYPLIEVLSEILEKTPGKKIIFNLFIQTIKGAISFRNDLEKILGVGKVEVFPNLSVPDYMKKLKDGDLAIDSHTFGGVNCVLDNICLGIPTISWQGWQHNNKAGSSILRKLGLDDLVAMNRDEYIEKVVKYINDDDYREKMSEKIRNIDLETELEKMTDLGAFKKAIDYLVNNHQELKNSGDLSPIFIF